MRSEVLILQPGVGAPRLARRSVREWLSAEGLDEFEERALVVVSELVSNAVVHARTVLELSFAAEGRNVEVGVRDQDRRSPESVWRLEKVAPNDGKLTEGGRGLAIVAALADEWGVSKTANGKRVWARWSGQPRSERSA